MYISGGKLRLTRVHKFTNHARLSAKIHASLINDGPNQASRLNKRALGRSRGERVRVAWRARSGHVKNALVTLPATNRPLFPR